MVDESERIEFRVSPTQRSPNNMYAVPALPCSSENNRVGVRFEPYGFSEAESQSCPKRLPWLRGQARNIRGPKEHTSVLPQAAEMIWHGGLCASPDF